MGSMDFKLSLYFNLFNFSSVGHSRNCRIGTMIGFRVTMIGFRVSIIFVVVHIPAVVVCLKLQNSATTSGQTEQAFG